MFNIMDLIKYRFNIAKITRYNRPTKPGDNYLGGWLICVECGKDYVIGRETFLMDIPPIMANNFCSRKCFDKMGAR